MCQQTISGYLFELSKLSAYSVGVATKLSQAGLKFPLKYFSVFPGRAVVFEIERIKENFGTVRLAHATGYKHHGLRSEFVEEKLSEVAVSRAELVDLSRSYDVDKKIESSEWLAYNTRPFLEAQRSVTRPSLVDEQKISEFRQIGFQRIAGQLGIKLAEWTDDRVPRKNLVVKSLEFSLKESGFKIRKDPERRFDGILRGLTGTDPFEFAIRIDSGPMESFPVFVNIYVRPKDDLVDDVSCDGGVLSKHQLIKPLWPLIPDFGLYIVCMSKNDICLCLYAYGVLLSELINFIRGDLVEHA